MTAFIIWLVYVTGWSLTGRTIAHWYYEGSAGPRSSVNESLAIGVIIGLFWPVVVPGWIMYRAIRWGWGFNV